jgi:Uma2 family endonuclease
MTAPPLSRHRFTVDEYHRMAENGVLTEDDRVELIDGEIIDMAPIGIGHIGHVNRFARVFGRLLGDLATVSPQNPVRLGPRLEPQPDVAVLRFRSDDYAGLMPTPEDVLLLVEVAESSLAYDRDVKGPMYARAGIPELWIVNLIGHEILVYRDPSPEGYRTLQAARPGDILRPLVFPDVEIAVSDVLVVPTP